MKTFGLSPCRQVGDIKAAIREAILDGHISNDSSQARAYMIEIGASMGIAPVVD